MSVMMCCTLPSSVRLGIKRQQLAGLQGMEYYSTVLWHLKRESTLAHLAQEAVSWDRRSPHAWAIMGNCFSLQKVGPLTTCHPHPIDQKHHCPQVTVVILCCSLLVCCDVAYLQQ